MVVLLLTTSSNAVRTVLSSLPDVKLLTIDCATSPETTKRVLAEATESFDIDVIVTYRCPVVLPEHIYLRARIGAFNIHPSLLPEYAGLNPWKAMFDNGETEGGVTIHRLSKAVDNGEILMQRAFPFPTPIDINTARVRADQIAAEMMVSLLNQIM